MLNSATKKSASMPGKGDSAEISQSAAAEESGSVEAQEQKLRLIVDFARDTWSDS